jgi:hypothetical protein
MVKIEYLFKPFDKIVLLRKERWGFLALLVILFYYRIFTTGSFYLMCYCVSFYLIYKFVAFCTPKEEGIPDPFEDFTEDVYLPTTIDDEFRPFIRRLPEFDFWTFCTKMLISALLCTLFPIFDIPVYAPVLVIYICIILFLSAYRMRAHMAKYNYNPFRSLKRIYKEME